MWKEDFEDNDSCDMETTISLIGIFLMTLFISWVSG